MKKRNFVFVVLMFIAIIITVSCTKNSPEQQSGGNKPTDQNKTAPTVHNNGKLKVVTSILPVYDIIKNVGGENVEVVNLLPPGGSPHTFEPSAEDAAAIENADLMFVVGLGLDAWLEKLAKASGDKYEGKILALSNGIKTIPLAEENLGEYTEHSCACHDPEHEKTHSDAEHKEDVNKQVHYDHGHAHEAGSADPHIWMDPVNMKKMAENARDALAAAKPEMKEAFTANCDAYIKQLDQLDKQYKETLDKYKVKNFITFHSFLAYTAKKYGMNQVAVIAADPGKEPDPQHLIKSIELLKKHNVKVVFAEPQFSIKASETIAGEINGKVVNVDPMGSLNDPQRDTYIKNMEENLKSLAEAFKTTNE